MDKRRIIWLEVTDSTNAVALAEGEKGADPGTVVVADSQTSGRGRLDRTWISPPGMGLYFSLILRPEIAPEYLPRITLAAGLALCRVLENEFGLSPQIKWPNDLVMDGKKLGGILTETGSVSGGQPLVVVGVGLNLSVPDGDFPVELSGWATALSFHLDREIPVESLLESCAASIENEVARLEKGDFPKVLEEWRQRDAVAGKELSWVTPQGKEVSGTSLGPDEEGLMQIRDRAGNIHAVISGDLNLVRKN